MVTSAIFIALLGTINLKPAISAAISSEPIQITVNENFNVAPDQVSREFQSLEPGVVHQGANFYFKPKFTLPSSSVPHHIEALISLIQQHHSCAQDATKEIFENKLMEILKPFIYAKETVTSIVLEEESSTKTAKPSSILITEETKPATPELLVIPEAPALPPLSFNGMPPLVEEELKKEELETKSVAEEPIVIEIQPKPVVSEHIFIPEAPVLPPFSADEMRIVGELKTVPESIVVDIESKPATPELLVIPEAPVLPPLSFGDISAFVEEEMKEKGESTIWEKSKVSSQEPTILEIEPKSAKPELLVIPEAPVLPPLSYNDVSAFVEEGIKKEESVILGKAQGVSEEPIVIEIEPKPTTPELLVIPEAPVLPPLSYNDVSAFVEEGIKKEESVILGKAQGVSEEPIVIEIEPKPTTPELLVIPEAPVLPPLSYKDVSVFVEEGIKKEESVILEIAKGVSEKPIIIEVEPKPVTPKHLVIPEAPVLPPLPVNGIRNVEEVKIEELKTVPESIVVDTESKPANPELLIIPEAPVLPPLSFDDISAFVEEEVKKEESTILQKAKSVSEEPIVIEIEAKPVTPEHLFFPEAPVLPPLSYNNVGVFVEEGIKKEESAILDKAKGVSEEPIVIEVEPKPVTPKHLVIPEAPVLPPLPVNGIRNVEEVKMEALKTVPESIVVDIESKPAIPELLIIPEGPVLPPLSFDDISAFVEEEVKKEESVLLEETKLVSEKPVIAVGALKPTTPELLVIPEAPVLPPLSYNDVSAFVEEGIKKEESVILEIAKGVSEKPIIIEVEPKPVTPKHLVIPEAPVLPPLPVNSIRNVEEVKIEELKTVPESIVVDTESKPANPELLIIPEAPVLPPLSFDDISAFVEEEVKKEESAILEKAKSVSEEPIVIEIEAKPVTPEHLFIPEAPVLPPLSYNDVGVFVEEGIKKEESAILDKAKGVSEEPIVIEVEPKPVTPEHLVIPEAPVLPPLPVNGIRSVEEVKIEEPKTVPESTVVDIESKPATPERLVIPEAPVLPPLSFDDISAFVEEEVKNEESVKLVETKGVSDEPVIAIVGLKPAAPELLVIPEAPVLPPLSYNNVSAFVEEGIKKEKSVILEKAQGVPEEPIVIEVEPKIVTPEHLVIPEAPVLPPLSFNAFSSTVEDEVKKEKSVLLKESTGVFPSISDPETVIVNVEPKPAIQELVIIPEAPVSPPMSDITTIEEVKSEESIISEEFTGRIPETSAGPTLESFVETETAESYALEDSKFPVAAEELKLEIPILLEESIEVFPAIAVSSRPTLQEHKMSNSYVLEKDSQPNSEGFVKKTFPPTIIRPSNNLGLFSYAPFLSHLSNHAPKAKQVMFPKPASLERFLLKKHPLRLPLTPFPKLPLNDIKSPFLENTNQFLYPTAYAHDVVEKRIAPNMAFKNNAPPKRVKIFIRSNAPKGSS